MGRRFLFVGAFLLAMPAWPIALGEGLPFSISRETSAITGPLRPDGTPDYIRAFNDRYSAGVTPENNAFVLWLQVVGTGETIISPRTRDRVLQMAGGASMENAAVWLPYENFLKARPIAGQTSEAGLQEFESLHGQLWRAGDHPPAAFFLKLQARFLDVAQQAAKRPHWWMPGVSSDGRSMISLNVPSLGHVRDVCNALCARATLRAEEGDFDGFLADVGAAKRIGRHLSCGNVLIAQLVGYRIEMMADRCMCAWAALGGWRNEQCMAVRGVWSGLPALPPAAEVIDIGERWGALDLVMQSAQGPAGENPLLPFEDASGIGHGFERGVNKGDVHWDTVLRRMNEQEDAMVAACNGPTFAEKRRKSRAVDDTLDQWGKDLPEHGLPRNAGESAEAYTERVARALCTTLLVRATPLLEFAQEQRTSDEMAQLMIACAWYKARENRWPAALADLVPSEIAKLPHDVFVSENAPIHYMATQKGACLRSVGRDGVEDAAGGSRRSRPDDIVLGASQAPGR